MRIETHIDAHGATSLVNSRSYVARSIFLAVPPSEFVDDTLTYAAPVATRLYAQRRAAPPELAGNRHSDYSRADFPSLGLSIGLPARTGTLASPFSVLTSLPDYQSTPRTRTFTSYLSRPRDNSKTKQGTSA